MYSKIINSYKYKVGLDKSPHIIPIIFIKNNVIKTC